MKKTQVIAGVSLFLLSSMNTITMDCITPDMFEAENRTNFGMTVNTHPALIQSPKKKAQSLRQSSDMVKFKVKPQLSVNTFITEEMTTHNIEKDLLSKLGLSLHLDQYGISNKIYRQFPNIKFGSMIMKMDDKFKESILLFEKLFDSRFSCYFKSAIEVVDQQLQNQNDETCLIIAKCFRHLHVPDYVHYSEKNQLGDFINEHILIKMLKNFDSETNPYMFSEICYELSQTYSHLLEGSMGKMVWDVDHQYNPMDADKGHLAIPGLENLSLSYARLEKMKLSLLKMSLIYTPTYPNSWIRVCEHLLYDQAKEYAFEKMVFLLTKYTESIDQEKTYPALVKKDYILSLVKKTREKQTAIMKQLKARANENRAPKVNSSDAKTKPQYPLAINVPIQSILKRNIDVLGPLAENESKKKKTNEIILVDNQ